MFGDLCVLPVLLLRRWRVAHTRGDGRPARLAHIFLRLLVTLGWESFASHPFPPGARAPAPCLPPVCPLPHRVANWLFFSSKARITVAPAASSLQKSGLELPQTRECSSKLCTGLLVIMGWNSLAIM